MIDDLEEDERDLIAVMNMPQGRRVMATQLKPIWDDVPGDRVAAFLGKREMALHLYRKLDRLAPESLIQLLEEQRTD